MLLILSSTILQVHVPVCPLCNQIIKKSKDEDVNKQVHKFGLFFIPSNYANIANYVQTMKSSSVNDCLVLENIHTPPRRFIGFHPHPSRNSNLAPYFSFNTSDFSTPLPLGISTDFPWGRHGYFLELHIAVGCGLWTANWTCSLQCSCVLTDVGCGLCRYDVTNADFENSLYIFGQSEKR